MFENIRKEHAPLLKEIRYSMHQFRQSTLSLVGFAIVLLFVFIAIFSPYLAPYDPNEIDLMGKLQPPSWEHLMGTDQYGRDMFSRVLYGTRYAFLEGFLIISISLSVGIALGLLSGYRGGLVDEVIMRAMDILLAFPYLVLAICIASAVMKPDGGFFFDPLISAILAISITTIPSYARLVRSTVLSVKETEFVEAARADGASSARIAFIHILPNCLAPLIVQATMTIGTAVISASAMSFLGLGAQPPTPEWGALITSGRNLLPDYWWCATFPGIAIFLFVMGFNLMGDGLRDVLDPRLRR
jgi:ABC-type dipeptide/oligopeptide/nickel transport system permease subunit